MRKNEGEREREREAAEVAGEFWRPAVKIVLSSCQGPDTFPT